LLRWLQGVPPSLFTRAPWATDDSPGLLCFVILTPYPLWFWSVPGSWREVLISGLPGREMGAWQGSAFWRPWCGFLWHRSSGVVCGPVGDLVLRGKGLLSANCQPWFPAPCLVSCCARCPGHAVAFLSRAARRCRCVTVIPPQTPATSECVSPYRLHSSRTGHRRHFAAAAHASCVSSEIHWYPSSLEWHGTASPAAPTAVRSLRRSRACFLSS
jgi:hypothetical protein